jgi:Rho-binding antiterminator
MISCSDHDYIEIACAYRYPIRLTLKSGDIINGTAKDTSLNKHREECILVAMEEADRQVILDDILIMEVTVENPHFRLVSFK